MIVSRAVPTGESGSLKLQILFKWQDVADPVLH